MKTTLISILFILAQATLWSQDNLWNNRETIIFQYKNYSDTNFRYMLTDNTNEILVSVSGTDSLKITHFIKPYSNGEFDNESLCDSIEVHLLCDTCVEFHISQMSNSKKRKWVKISDSLYISTKNVSKFWPADKTSTIYTIPMMKIINKQHFTQIILYTESFTKKKWDEMKKGRVTNSK